MEYSWSSLYTNKWSTTIPKIRLSKSTFIIRGQHNRLDTITLKLLAKNRDYQFVQVMNTIGLVCTDRRPLCWTTRLVIRFHSGHVLSLPTRQFKAQQSIENQTSVDAGSEKTKPLEIWHTFLTLACYDDGRNFSDRDAWHEKPLVLFDAY